jgi:hypothetical protein
MRRLVVLLALTACSSFGSDGESSSGGTPDAGTTPTPAPPPPGTPPPPPPPSPGTAPELVMNVQGTLRAILVTEQYVYVASDGGNNVYRAKVTDTKATAETFRHTNAAPISLAANGKTIFVAETGASTLAALQEDDLSVYTRKTQPAAATMLVWAGGSLWWTAADDSLYRSDASLTSSSPIASPLPAPLGISATAQDVWFVVSGAGQIQRAPLTGGSPGIEFDGQSDPRAIATSSAGVFWTLGGGKVRGALIGKAPTDLVVGAVEPMSIAADDTHVYWQDSNGTYRIKTDGTDRVTLGAASRPSLTVYRGIALTPTHVFWVDAVKGDVWRRAK